jgi:biopolymer transport protein ExbD
MPSKPRSIAARRIAVLGVLLNSAIAAGCAQPHPQARDARPAVSSGEQLETRVAPAEPVARGPQLSLPLARNVAPLRADWPVLTISTEEVLLGGRRVADVPALAAKARIERIEELIGPLKALKEGAGNASAGSVLIRADERVTFQVLFHLLFSSAQAGYTHFEYAVADGPDTEARVNVTYPRPEDRGTGEEVVIVLVVRRDGYVFATSVGDRVPIPARSGAFDGEALERLLAERRKLEPTRRQISLAPTSDVPYGAVVAALDTLVGHGFNEVWLANGENPESELTQRGDPQRGSLSKEDIRRVIGANLDMVRACYERAMSFSTTAFEGRVSIQFTIAPDGTVRASEVVSNSTGSGAVAACIAEEVRHWQFPAPQGGGIVIVTYPFVLEAMP